jgi:hypothetical protein
VPVAAAALCYVFLYDRRSDIAAYAVYAFSAYVLTLVCVRIARSAGHAKENLDTVMDRVPIVRRYFTDIPFQVQVTLYRSLALNVLYAVMKFAFSVYYRSVWFGTLAVYYLLLALTRFALIHYANRNAFGTNMVSEWKRYRLCGMILLLMNLALTGVVIMVTEDNEGFYYPGYLIYVMAMYAFYSIAAAIVNMVKYRKYRSPVMSASKALHLAAAMVSMLALETAMLAQFNGSDREDFRAVMTACTGGAVCAVVLVLAVIMICRSTKKIKAMEQEEF